MRALAVLAVMAFHEGLGVAPGGFLGVDVFFVLSGYLITDLLVSRKERAGSLGLRSFWVRRARRLLPALAVMLVVVTAAVAVIEPGQMGSLRPALLAAVTYSSNWYQAFHHVSYFQSFGPPPPLQHLWSLAIEEQFYLIWPLVLALLALWHARPRVKAAVAWAGAAASAVVAALLYVPGADPSRVYYGTDTHATALLTGAALALTWPLAKVAASPKKTAARLDILGIGGLAVLAWAVGHFSGTDPVVYPLGLAIAAAGAAGLVIAAAAPGAVSAALSLRPLRWLGVRSYGIYLWHWPVIAVASVLTHSAPALPWLWAAESVAAVALAAASWKWVEEPILRGGFRASCRKAYNEVMCSAVAARWSPRRAVPSAVAAVALCVACVACYGLAHTSPTSGLEQQIAAGEQVSVASQAGGTGTGTAVAGATGLGAPGQGTSEQGTPEQGATGQGAVLTGARTLPAGPSGAPAPPAAGTASAPQRVRGSQVTAIGDSVMLASAAELAAALPGIYIDAQVSRQMSAGLAVVQRLAARGKLRPVVVVGLGTNGTVTQGQIQELLRILGPGRKLILVNTFEARSWEGGDNSVLAWAARHHRNVVLANWHDAIEGRTDLLWSDGVHPQPPGAHLYTRVVVGAIEATRFLSG